MSLAIITSRSLDGLAAPEVQVEVHLANGLPSFTLVGLADKGGVISAVMAKCPAARVCARRFSVMGSLCVSSVSIDLLAFTAWCG